MEQKKKTGLVVEGGGMKCAYNAGILDAFLDEGITFDYCIGVSGGSGNLFGIPYIYGTLTNADGKDPLDFPAFMKNPAEYQAVVTNASTGKPEYYGKEMLSQDDYRLIMASSAIPAACRPVEMKGKLYYDGGISDAIPVQHALAKGCDRLVVILSKNRGYVREPQGMHFLYSRLCRKYPRIVEAIEHRHITYNENLKQVFAMENQGLAFVFAPSETIQAGTYTMDEKAEKRLYSLGIKDFKNRQDELKQFLSS